MKPNDSKLHRPHSYCSSKTCLVWCKSGELGRSQVTSYFLFTICFPEILYGGYTIKFLYTLNWLAVMSSWYHSCASWLVHQYWTRRTTAYQNPCSIKKFGNIAPFLQLLSPFLRSLVLCPDDFFFMGCCAPQSLHILQATRMCCLQDMHVFIVDPGILLKRKTNNISLYH